MRIIIGAPANGAALKDAVLEHLRADSRVESVTDLSTADITYPDVSFRAAHAVAPVTACTLADVWLDARHDPASAYGAKLEEITAYEAAQGPR